ncbi:MAG: DUF4363 family protein [Oscillospiraceae bacterium]|nr:DUF4363 family protein [Oscillospiraceae bacterium]
MKRFPLSVVIITVTILACIFSLLYIKNIKDRYETLLDKTYSQLVNDNIDGAKKSLEKFNKGFEKDEKILMYIVQKSDLEEISFQAEVLEQYLKAEEMPEARAELKKITALLNHIWEKEAPLFENIF